MRRKRPSVVGPFLSTLFPERVKSALQRLGTNNLTTWANRIGAYGAVYAAFKIASNDLILPRTITLTIPRQSE